MVSNSWREVTHFWYLGWPEKGIPPEANSMIAFLIEARSYMKTATLDMVSKSSRINTIHGQHLLPRIYCLFNWFRFLATAQVRDMGEIGSSATNLHDETNVPGFYRARVFISTLKDVEG